MRRFRMILRVSLVFACAVSAASLVEAAEPARHGKAIKSFRRYAEKRMQHDPAPGMTIGFMYGTTVWVEGFGYAELENKVPARDVSAYRLASVTKPMTAIGILKLMEDGKLDLDAEVQAYVPDFPRKQWPVRVRALLGHLGGISHYRDYDAEGHFKDHKNTREALAVFADFDLVAEPGTRYNYSSYGYNLLGAVIEAASGEPYGEFMARVLWEPLGMDDTRMDDPNAVIPHRVRGYRPDPEGEVVPSEFVDISSRFAAGGTRSTVVDLLHFAAGLRDGRVLSPESVDLMWTPMVTSDERETGYGMGWSLRAVNGRFMAMHTGGQAETRTLFAYVPSLQLAIAVAMNYEGSDRMPYARRLYQLLLDEGYNQALYAPARRDQHLADVMEAVFDAGVPHHDRRVRALREDTAALDAAFAYVNELLAPAAPDADAATARDKIEAGRHPVSGSPLPIAGSYMASVVARANDGLDAVHRNGAPELFAAYIEAYRAGTSVRHAHRFAAPVESELLALCDAWRRTWTNDTRQMTWPTYGDLDAIQPLMSKLERRFEAVRVYPDYSSELSRFVTQRVIQEDADAAVHAAEWTLALYPWSASARIDAALARAAAGDVDRASEYASAALAASPDGLASASRLNQRAYGLRSAGGLQAGLALLDLARRLHPDAANLYDSTGDFHLAAGRRDEAISWYEKALEVDPEFENARRVLDRLRAESAAITGR